MSEYDITLCQGDTDPRGVVLKSGGSPLDLSNATSITFVMTYPDKQPYKEVTCTKGCKDLDDDDILASAGGVTIPFDEDSLGSYGIFIGQFIILFPDQTTYPGEGYYVIKITESLKQIE